MPSFDRRRRGDASELVEVIGADELRAWERVPLALLKSLERSDRDQCAGQHGREHGRVED